MNGAELRVYFLNSFYHKSIYEKLSKKDQIVKKSARILGPLRNLETRSVSLCGALASGYNGVHLLLYDVFI